MSCFDNSWTLSFNGSVLTFSSAVELVTSIYSLPSWFAACSFIPWTFTVLPIRDEPNANFWPVRFLASFEIRLEDFHPVLNFATFFFDLVYGVLFRLWFSQIASVVYSLWWIKTGFVATFWCGESIETISITVLISRLFSLSKESSLLSLI